MSVSDTELAKVVFAAGRFASSLDVKVGRPHDEELTESMKNLAGIDPDDVFLSLVLAVTIYTPLADGWNVIRRAHLLVAVLERLQSQFGMKL
jgi:hypothetical protein